jgi:tRNA(Ile)-lysidine synthase
MSLLNRFIEIVKREHLFTQKDKLLLAVSGGVDSVVLCELCKQAGYDFIIAHCNFLLRWEESNRDEQFVRSLGAKYNVGTFVREFDTKKYAEDNHLSIQEAARKIRYDYFHLLIAESNYAKYLLTAHHSDDNSETLLMNFFRGTGLHGLTGIPASINYIRRPLLSFSKDELLEFAKVNNLEFVEDSSNQSSKYTRNFFRNEIIPAISKVYPQVRENLQDNISRFAAIEKLYQLSVAELKKKLCKEKGKEIHIPVKPLMAYDNKALIYEIISGYGFHEKQVDEVVKLAESDSGKYIQSAVSDYRLIKHRNWFIISPAIATESVNIIIEVADKEILFELGKLIIEKTPVRTHQSSNVSVSIDAKEIQFPLLLRKRKTGDYFYPLGMKKKKKINRFVIDQKLSKTEKENIWVIESNQRIIWVVGHRIDERFKLTENTKAVLSLRLSPAK